MNRIIGLDLGSRTCGIARSDLMGIIASPVETVRFEEDDYEACLEKVAGVVRDNKADTIVLGLPKHMNGDIGVRGEVSIRFKEMLEEELEGIKVILVDERLTTVTAQKSMIASNMNRKKRHEMVDAMAAVVILQSYLDGHR